MKKLICILLITCFFPIPVKAIDQNVVGNYSQGNMYKQVEQDIVTGVVWTVVICYVTGKIYAQKKIMKGK